MNQMKLEAEVIQISIYSEIILDILKKHKNLSVNKMLVFTYLIIKDRFIPSNIYNGKHTQDIIYKCLSLLSGDFIEYCNSIEFIIKAIHLLKSKGEIIVENGIIQQVSTTNSERSNSTYHESKFIGNAIEYSRKISDRQFMREVINNV
ncbi:hypothetical protein [Paenibacillus lautus]|uniref:hypothetical protein n=1 Tax=Paenibacillus lautus TaxID=1401 RepID=UPI001C7CE886|nr:hypothetical protein [Paenibacillus lautus]MBX4147277.1 hypothetical protein [Paenibacillus lautus]